MAHHHHIFTVVISVLIVAYPNAASVLSWLTGGTPTTPRYPVEQVRPLTSVGQRNPYPEGTSI